jgi:F-type H+-transporting ATPase subunit b
MENTIDFVIPQKLWILANSFRLNTNLLETNLINLGVVLGLLVYFGKGVCAD